jgi:5-carboxymethyl-2-hydroxymuconate isomerase
MPHFAVQYSPNLEGEVDMAAFCDHLRQTACGIDAFPTPGIRVRAFRADHYSIADGNPDHGFIDISIRLRAGRSEAVKADATQRIFEAARSFLTPVLQSRSLALSLEMRDIDPDLSPKTGTIRDYI